MKDLGHWQTSLEIPENCYGFIYKITNKVNNKFYIGKKQMVTKYRKPLKKGRKNRESVIRETDWKSYTSSSNELNADIAKYGKDNFVFEIIHCCNSKAQLAYFEAKIQFSYDVLITENCYNGIINCRIPRFKNN